MSESTINAIITAIGSLLGGFVGAYATIKAAEIKEKSPLTSNGTESKSLVSGIIAGAVIGAIITLVILVLLGLIPPTSPGTTSTVTPTIQEPTENWELGELIYEENFEDGTINGLKTKWGVFDIVQANDGNYVWRTSTSSFSQLSLPTTSADYAVETKIMQVSGQKGFGFIQIRMESGEPCNAGYEIYLDGYGDWLNLVEFGHDCDELREDGLFANRKTSLSNGVWYTLRIETKGKEVRVYFNEKLVAQDKDIDGTVRESNVIGFSTCCGDLEPFVFDFDDIKVWLLNP